MLPKQDGPMNNTSTTLGHLTLTGFTSSVKHWASSYTCPQSDCNGSHVFFMCPFIAKLTDEAFRPSFCSPPMDSASTNPSHQKNLESKTESQKTLKCTSMPHHSSMGRQPDCAWTVHTRRGMLTSNDSIRTITYQLHSTSLAC